MKNLVVDFTVR